MKFSFHGQCQGTACYVGGSKVILPTPSKSTINTTATQHLSTDFVDLN